MDSFISTSPRHRPANDESVAAAPTQTAIRIHVDFKSLRQARLLDRLLKRITRHDLQSMMFKPPDTDELLTVLGTVREPLKSIPQIYEHHESQEDPSIR